MKRLLALFVLTLSLSSLSAFAQEMDEARFNKCIDVWIDYDNSVNATRTNLCYEKDFADCILGTKVPGSIYSKLTFCQKTKGNVPQTCEMGWIAFDGRINEYRKEMCQREAFSYCVAAHVVEDGILTEKRIATCLDKR